MQRNVIFAGPKRGWPTPGFSIFISLFDCLSPFLLSETSTWLITYLCFLLFNWRKMSVLTRTYNHTSLWAQYITYISLLCIMFFFLKNIEYISPNIAICTYKGNKVIKLRKAIQPVYLLRSKLTPTHSLILRSPKFQ